MQILKGDLWDFHAKGWKIVISTNIGWTERRPAWSLGKTYEEGVHVNNMGAGIAAQAAQRWPWLPQWLGSHYRAVHQAGMVQRPVEHDRLGLIFVAVKPLLVSDPAYSWNQRASVVLIKEQLGMLAQHQGKIALGYVGCGNGAADQKDVLPHLLKLELVRGHLGHGETIVVDREAA
jgi:hypothetical protein